MADTAPHLHFSVVDLNILSVPLVVLNCLLDHRHTEHDAKWQEGGPWPAAIHEPCCLNIMPLTAAECADRPFDITEQLAVDSYRELAMPHPSQALAVMGCTATASFAQGPSSKPAAVCAADGDQPAFLLVGLTAVLWLLLRLYWAVCAALRTYLTGLYGVRDRAATKVK